MSLSRQHGIYRTPTVHRDRVVFVTEDDLWEVPLGGGRASRLTALNGAASRPRLSPCGGWIAFSATEEGGTDVYLVPSSGGPVRRLTWFGSAAVVGWTPEGRIVFASSHDCALRQGPWLHTIAAAGGTVERIEAGPATRIAHGARAVAIGRKAADPARWKRYRGGTAGEIYVDEQGDGNFRRILADLAGNLTDPMAIGGRLYFLSDHEGLGNVYSVTFGGDDLRQHTSHTDFYARGASTDGRTIVYHCGGDLYALDPAGDAPSKIEVEYGGPRPQAQRKFVDAAENLHGTSLSPDGDRVAAIVRGKPVVFAGWEGGAEQFGERQGVRYRLARFLPDGERLVVASDAGGEDHLEIIPADPLGTPEVLDLGDIGRPMEIIVAPEGDRIAVATNRNELHVVDLAGPKATLVERDRTGVMGDAAWSPDGRWLAYGAGLNKQQRVIKVYDTQESVTHVVTSPVLSDSDPAWDPEGKYLFFLSARTFNPVYDNMQFELGFPMGQAPYAIALKKDTPSLFVPKPKGFGEEKKDGEEASGGNGEDKGKEEGKEKDVAVEIDFDGITSRIEAFPVGEGRYSQLGAAKGRILYTTMPVEGALGQNWMPSAPPAKATLKAFKFDDRKEITVSAEVSGFELSLDGSALLVRVGNGLRLHASGTDELPSERETDRKAGWIDLGRVRVDVDLYAEWKQIVAEAWRLQRDYFWTEDMSGVDWDGVRGRYLPLVDRVSTRGELSDLIWEMQGELGSSHAYEAGGDYRPSPAYPVGFLGVDWTWDSEAGAWRIGRVVEGDPWDASAAPPLLRPGTGLAAGDAVLAVNGQRLGMDLPPQAALVHLAGTEVRLLVQRAGEDKPATVDVKALGNESLLRYREWVEANRRFVHEQTGGRVGYVHVPDMGPRGFAEFHRGYLAEYDREGLVIDVRYNGGGHVSQLVLEKLARKRIGYDKTRWMGEEPYPGQSPRGPMVCLTNEHAGSDGDIVSHSFKLMGLGKLVGRRTWGGVIGIWPRNALVDGGVVTQPEFSFWFEDVGWGVENYGTDPDIEVDMLPQDWAAGRDPQLDKAVEVALEEIAANPPLEPRWEPRPRLGLGGGA